MKKIILVFFILLIILIGCLYIVREIKIYNLSDYYKNLARECGLINLLEIGDCCISSIKDMAEHNFKAKQISGCPEGFEAMAAMCRGSISFCVPNNSASDLFNPVIKKSGNFQTNKSINK